MAAQCRSNYHITLDRSLERPQALPAQSDRKIRTFEESRDQNSANPWLTFARLRAHTLSAARVENQKFTFLPQRGKCK